MITVWKFPLEVKDVQYVDTPRGAKFLSVDVQNGTPCLWVQVDTDAPIESLPIITHGTGHPMKKPDMKFIGTYQLDGFVGHVFVAGAK